MTDNLDGEVAITKEGFMFVVCEKCIEDESLKRLRKREPDPEREQLEDECSKCGRKVFL